MECIYCGRDLLSGPTGKENPVCAYAEDHPTGRVYARGDKDVRPVQVIVKFFVEPDVEDPRDWVAAHLQNPILDFEVLPQVWKYTGKETTRNIGGRPEVIT